MSGITLYYSYVSPPSRSVLALIKYHKAPVTLKFVDLSTREQFSPEFVALNPLHTVPTLVKQAEGATEPELVIYESAAIIEYLADYFKWTEDYGMSTELSQKYAVVNVLHNHSNFLSSAVRTIMANIYGPVFGGAPFDLSALQSSIETVQDKFQTFNQILEKKGGFVTGPTPTCADTRVWIDLFNMSNKGGKFTLALVDYSKYPAIEKWLDTLKAVFFDENDEAWVAYAGFISHIDSVIPDNAYRQN